MSRRYDQRTTTFSPEGRLFQVEYAIDAVSKAPSVVGILAKDGIVLAAERKTGSKLLARSRASEKMYEMDRHALCTVAGLTSDANVLIDQTRQTFLQYRLHYGEPMPIEQAVVRVCDWKHYYTQSGGMRPFGVTLMYAGWDRHHGFQLYHSDPSGNYAGWSAHCIGTNQATGTSLLKTEYKEDITVSDALRLAGKVLCKTMDTTTPTSEKMEFATLMRTAEGEVVQQQLSDEQAQAILDEVKEAAEAEGDK